MDQGLEMAYNKVAKGAGVWLDLIGGKRQHWLNGIFYTRFVILNKKQVCIVDFDCTFEFYICI